MKENRADNRYIGVWGGIWSIMEHEEVYEGYWSMRRYMKDNGAWGGIWRIIRWKYKSMKPKIVIISLPL